MIFKKTKKRTKKYTNAPKMRQVILNARIYAKQKINLTWPKQV